MQIKERKLVRLETDHWMQNWALDEAVRRNGTHMGVGGLNTLNVEDFIESMDNALEEEEIEKILNILPPDDRQRFNMNPTTLRNTFLEAKSLAESVNANEIEFINNR